MPPHDPFAGLDGAQHHHHHHDEDQRPHLQHPYRVDFTLAFVSVCLSSLSLWWFDRSAPVVLLCGLGLTLVSADLACQWFLCKTLVTQVHLYFYLLATPTYLRLGQILPDWLIARITPEYYHGKVLSHEHALALMDPRFCVSRRVDLGERILPWKHARDLIWNSGTTIALVDCPCRVAKPENHCTPTRVCFALGGYAELAQRIHGEGKCRFVTREEAVKILEEEHAKGRVHTAWFKDVAGNKFFGLCNCCKCCCQGIALMMRGHRVMTSSGFVPSFDSSKCVRCGACARACPFTALSMTEGPTTPKLDWAKCMGCGACEVKCPRKAISMQRDESKGDPLDVRQLSSMQW